MKEKLIAKVRDTARDGVTVEYGEMIESGVVLVGCMQRRRNGNRKYILHQARYSQVHMNKWK